METTSLHAAWIGIVLGLVAGTVQGMFFHREDWLGGYAAWPRRMIRLAHVSFFGIAFINLAYALSVRFFDIEHPSAWPPLLFIAGAVTMPVVCYLSAYRKPLRHLFFVPVLSLLAGAVIFCVGVLRA